MIECEGIFLSCQLAQKVVKIKENFQCRVVLIQTDKEKMSETNESAGFHK